MKTKIIPFDLETAKKIQAGEIKGKIIDDFGNEGSIITFNGYNTPLPIVVIFRFLMGDNIHYIDNDGRPTQIKLLLEIPDNEPKFKVGDKVRVRPNGTHSHFVEQYDNCIGKIIGEHRECFTVVVQGAFQDRFGADELELVGEAGKHEFKPFDRVLVRDQDDCNWCADFYSHLGDDGIYICVSCGWNQCIPYEGHEYLLGTTDKPKED